MGSIKSPCRLGCLGAPPTVSIVDRTRARCHRCWRSPQGTCLTRPKEERKEIRQTCGQAMEARLFGAKTKPFGLLEREQRPVRLRHTRRTCWRVVVWNSRDIFRQVDHHRALGSARNLCACWDDLPPPRNEPGARTALTWDEPSPPAALMRVMARPPCHDGV